MSDRLTVKSLLREYEVVFSDRLEQDLLEEASSSFFLVDQGVLDSFPSLFDPLPTERILPIVATEKAKDIDSVSELARTLIEKGLRRGNRMVAVGGGVVQDVTAFAASIIYRGIDWIYFPTTLAAQADSCIGSKTSINLGPYKNLLGNFYPPLRIVNSEAFLATLSDDEIRSGIGEILHYYLIADSPLTERLVREYPLLLSDRARLRDFILESLAIKKRTIEIDEFDRKERRVFNYGHTFGHALETVSGYSVPHGQAVTRGMDVANYLSMRLGHLAEAEYAAMRDVLDVNLPDQLVPEGRMDDYMVALSRDKKNRTGELGCILTQGRGRMFFTHIPLDDRLRGMLVDYFAAERALAEAGA